ncbi:hypothetical protein YP76_24080 [Sphingobium chungbukense]|uniref:Uncharacterized protein n=1 Tax=Sphingobium chungbukense TaxID=56193 RepID=A0A0M3AIB3_9SPHN|nr:hypothetical protein YP76_24080 [Sphingobium chungbukense]
MAHYLQAWSAIVFLGLIPCQEAWTVIILGEDELLYGVGDEQLVKSIGAQACPTRDVVKEGIGPGGFESLRNGEGIGYPAALPCAPGRQAEHAFVGVKSRLWIEENPLDCGQFPTLSDGNKQRGQIDGMRPRPIRAARMEPDVGW